MTDAAPAMFRTELKDSVLLAIIDMPGRTMNVFSWELMNQLDALLDRVEGDGSVQALVLTSGKPTFLAGADLEMVQTFAEMGRSASRAELHQTCGRLGRLFNRLEAIAKPTVAAINGLAMGGGLEVAMACRRRIVADDPRIQLGLPEIKLGLMAAAGGTQRLPRLIGIEKGIELLLSGKSIPPAEAKTLGLVDEVVPPADLISRATSIARALIAKGDAPRPRAALDPGPFDLASPDAVAAILLRLGYAEDRTRRYPAYAAAVRATLGGASLQADAGGDHEMDCFVDLMKDPVAGRMVTTLFLNRQKADKLTQQFKGLSGARFALAAEGAAADMLRAALVAAKANLIDVAQATGADVVIASAVSPAKARADLLLIEDAVELPGGRAGVFLAPSREHGAALEIVGADGKANEKGLALARQLRATPYLNPTRRSLLAALARARSAAAGAGLDEDGQIAAMGLAARETGAENSAMADVASVVSGLFPSWAGGPIAWLAEQGEAGLAAARARYGGRAPAVFGERA
jgi:3-hydroxyacyl-CoA dehydrogenase/enoyl-CoA hydratase/3-hydroxybutyryl-CoA epimerase